MIERVPCDQKPSNQLQISVSARANKIDPAVAMGYNNSPYAACKFLRRKCLAGCIFAPYLPSEEPHKFANAHKIFGASNAAKLLNELLPQQRKDANSLAYVAEARVKDPVHGCVGSISVLQRQVQRLQNELDAANSHLLRYACDDRILRKGMPPLIPPPPAITHQTLTTLVRNADHGADSTVIRRIMNSCDIHGADHGSEAAAAAAGRGGPSYDHHQAPTQSSNLAALPSPPSSTNIFSDYYSSIDTRTSIPLEYIFRSYKRKMEQLNN